MISSNGSTRGPAWAKRLWQDGLIQFGAGLLCLVGLLYAFGCAPPSDPNSVSNTVSAPTLAPNGGNSVREVDVALSCDTSGAQIRYTTDGSDPTSASQLYSAPVHLTSTTTIKAYARKEGMDDSAVTSATFTIVAPAPSFTPDGGAFTEATQVTISCPGVDATIYYTLDGSTPASSSSVCDGPLTLTEPTTVKAIACVEGMDDSAVSSAVFDVDIAPVVELTLHAISDTSGTKHTADPGTVKTTFARGEEARITLVGTNTGGEVYAKCHLQVSPEGDHGTLIYDSHDASKTPTGTIEDIVGGLALGETLYYSFDIVIPNDATGRLEIAGALRDPGQFATIHDSTADGANNNTLTDAWLPGPIVEAVSEVLELATGMNFSVAVWADGAMWAWGANGYGQLGDGTTTDQHTPIEVSTLTNVISVGAGNCHTVALRSDQTVWTWGWNNHGQLGDGTTDNRSTPAQVPGLTHVIAVAAGDWHSVALRDDHTVWVWGRNDYGQLGLGAGDTTDRHGPVQVPGLTNVIAIDAGTHHTVAIRSDDTLWSWGSNEDGQIGDGTNIDRHTPTHIASLTNVVSVDAAYNHTFALLSDGTVRAWGYNSCGELGDGTTINRNAPVQVVGLTDVVAVDAGTFHAAALKDDGTVYAWGANWLGQVGDGTGIERHTPVQVFGLTDVIEIDACYSHTIALRSWGTVWAWGHNQYGQLGDGTTEDRFLPVQVIWP